MVVFLNFAKAHENWKKKALLVFMQKEGIYTVYTEFSMPGQIPKYVIRYVIKYHVIWTANFLSDEVTSCCKQLFSRLVSSCQLNSHFLYSITIYIYIYIYIYMCVCVCVCYVIILNMFRAVLCSSSGGQILLLQPLVSPLSVNFRPLCRSRADCSPLSTGILDRDWRYQRL